MCILYVKETRGGANGSRVLLHTIRRFYVCVCVCVCVYDDIRFDDNSTSGPSSHVVHFCGDASSRRRQCGILCFCLDRSLRCRPPWLFFKRTRSTGRPITRNTTRIYLLRTDDRGENRIENVVSAAFIATERPRNVRNSYAVRRMC